MANSAHSWHCWSSEGKNALGITWVVLILLKSYSGLNLAVAFAAILQDFRIEHKILSVTCDNTSNNDTMVKKIDSLLTTFSAVNQTRCFNHILNLITKSLLKQLDLHWTDKEASDLDNDEQSLLGLAGDIDEEELTMEQENDSKDGGIEEDDLEDWVDEIAALTPEEQEDLEASIHPVKYTLVKLHKLVFKIIHSTTLLLPAWKESLKLLKLAIRIMPHNIWQDGIQLTICWTLWSSIERQSSLLHLTGKMTCGSLKWVRRSGWLQTSYKRS